MNLGGRVDRCPRVTPNGERSWHNRAQQKPMIAHRSSHICWKLLKEQVDQKKKNKVKEKKKKRPNNYIGPDPRENVQFHR